MEEKKAELVQWARYAEQTDQFDDMGVAMKAAAETGIEFDKGEQNLLSVAFKNIVGSRRSSYRVMGAIEEKVKDSEFKYKLAIKYREKVEKELEAGCLELLGILDKSLIPNATAAESVLFYQKMKGDYYRYIAEIHPEDQRSLDGALDGYSKAFEVGRKNLPATHQLRLGLALNFSVFYYEILNMQDKACKLAKHSFDEAVGEIEELDEEAYKNATNILQLLRDNLALWTSDNIKDDDDEEEEAGEAA